jgi:hypothetical protein
VNPSQFLYCWEDTQAPPTTHTWQANLLSAWLRPVSKRGNKRGYTHTRTSANCE